MKPYGVTMWDSKYLIWFGIICVAIWAVEKFILSKKSQTDDESKKRTVQDADQSDPLDLENMLEGSELVAFIRNEKLFLTTGGHWLFIQRLKDRLNYSTFTPWEARNYILKSIQKKDMQSYAEKKAEVLKKYKLKGDKKELHFPYVKQVKKGKLMIKT